MLLVAAILMVSTTYAWFTLSTAPEVTGITTQVGANGNLEIALLTTDTYDSTASITSSTGDSLSTTNKKATDANVTWGNLIDLSDSSYGLSEISLLPASLNGTTTVNTASPLNIPVYGADGRVNTVDGSTVSAIKDSGSFKVTAAQSYGVRAVGTADKLSAKAIALRSAKSGVNSSVNAAKTNLVSAISANAAPFVLLAMQDTISITTLTQDQIDAVEAIAEAMSASLDNILAGYKYVAIAELTQVSGLSDEAFATAQQAINEAADAAALKTLVSASGLSTDQQNKINTQLDKITTDKTKITTAIATLKDADTTTNLSSTVTDVLGENIPHTKDADTNTYYLTGGVLNDIALEVSTFQLISAYGYTANAGAKDAGTGVLAGLNTSVNALSASSTDTDANIVTTYGYAIDFAFRTNAASSNLLLQTAGTNRVYSSETDGDLATQGAGSYVEFTLANGEKASQATKLVEALRIAFYNPETGKLLATAAVGDITSDTTTVKGNLYLVNTALTVTQAVLGKDMYEKDTTEGATGYKLIADKKLPVQVTNGTTALAESNSVAPSAANCTNYKATITAQEYTALAAKTTTVKTTGLQSDKSAITALTQNTVEKVTALVYLDGETIDNTAVVNASTSGSLNLNLQFSSSADLVPMDNSTLKSLEKTITASISGAEPEAYNSAVSYTVTTNSTKSIKKVEWTSGTPGTATVPDNSNDTTTTVTLTGANTSTSAATTELKVKITFADDSTVEATKTVTFPGKPAETVTSG
jgi:hypothetical protein